MRGVVWNKRLGGRGLGNRKCNSWVGVEEILFEALKQNTKKLKCFEFQIIGKTHQVHQQDQATHSIKALTKVQFILRNEVNNWQ